TDDLPAAHRRPLADTDARLVGVGGDDPVAVVDQDDLAVAALPASEDHHAVLGGSDRVARVPVDVEAGVQAPPAVSELGGHRVAAGPYVAAGRRRARPGTLACADQLLEPT